MSEGLKMVICLYAQVGVVKNEAVSVLEPNSAFQNDSESLEGFFGASRHLDWSLEKKSTISKSLLDMEAVVPVAECKVLLYFAVKMDKTNGEK